MAENKKIKSKANATISTKSKTYKVSKTSMKNILSKHKKEVLVELRNVDVIFGKQKNAVHAVKDMSLNIYKGEVIGIVGESGSGKSTTGNAIIGLVDRAGGTIKIKGRDIPSQSKKIKGEINDFMVKTVQMIFQDPASSLNPYKTIYKIISEGLKNIDSRQVFAKTFDGITATTLSDLLKNKTQPVSLSKVSLKWISKKIEEDNFEAISKVLYNQAITDLYKMKKDYAREAANYLRMRKNVREDILQNKNSKKLIEERLINDIIVSVGLSDNILGRYPLEFSGGQQQRIGISRAVILKPDILIADEPISALDVSIQAQVVNIFNNLKNKLDLTIVFIAHDLRMVEYISDRIAVMYKGVLLELGTASEIVNNPIHPYTRSLISSIPTIDKVNTSLRSKRYVEKDANADKKWYSINNSTDNEHYVMGTEEEITNWVRGKYE